MFYVHKDDPFVGAVPENTIVDKVFSSALFKWSLYGITALVAINWVYGERERKKRIERRKLSEGTRRFII